MNRVWFVLYSLSGYPSNFDHSEVEQFETMARVEIDLPDPMINQFSIFGLSKSFLLLRLFILREGLRKTPLISEENVRELIGSNIFFFILFSSRWNDDGYRGLGGLHGREGTNNKISFSLFNLFSIFSIFRSICFHQHERKSRKTFLLSETGKARDSPTLP